MSGVVAVGVVENAGGAKVVVLAVDTRDHLGFVIFYREVSEIPVYVMTHGHTTEAAIADSLLSRVGRCWCWCWCRCLPGHIRCWRRRGCHGSGSRDL